MKGSRWERHSEKKGEDPPKDDTLMEISAEIISKSPTLQNFVKQRSRSPVLRPGSYMKDDLPFSAEKLRSRHRLLFDQSLETSRSRKQTCVPSHHHGEV